MALDGLNKLASNLEFSGNSVVIITLSLMLYPCETIIVQMSASFDATIVINFSSSFLINSFSIEIIYCSIC